MEDEIGALQRLSLFLEKGGYARPWRLSARSLNGTGYLNRYYGSPNRPLTAIEVDTLIADVTATVRQFAYVHGVQGELPGVAEE